MGIKIQKNIACVLLFAFLNLQIAFCDPISGYVEKQGENQQALDKELFTGEVEKLDEKSNINLTVSQVLSSGFTLEGDEFFAEVSSDVETDKGVIIPTGTIAHGIVKYIENPKNMGRDGWVNVDFDYMVTPDGRQIPIQASFSTKDSLAKSTVKSIAHHTGYTLLGGVAGGFVALNMLGLGAAVASNGYTLAGGAAIGSVIGLTCAIIKKGDGFSIAPGDEIKITVQESIDMPVFSPNAFRQEELFLENLKVRINSVNFEKDPFENENTITLSLGIDNYSDYTFSTFDIALVAQNQQVYFPSPFGDTSLWFKSINPGDRVAGKLSFCVNDKKAKHWLVFYDRKTKKPLAKYSIDNAKLDIKQLAKQKEKNKKQKRKKS
ncbi:MAG: TrbI/VirB10 family protein [Candidatus Gastranaerophilales bacterium]|nr:TrbI/VirB10 family protein [Candidatus Gastranaerophilales bacterium]